MAWWRRWWSAIHGKAWPWLGLSRPRPAALRTLVGVFSVVTLVSLSLAWDAQHMLDVASGMGPKTLAGAQALQAEMAKAAPLDELQRVERMNAFFNKRIAFAEDTDVWGQVDYWASPLESLSKGRGDCEDYAIGKYFSLLALGTPAAKLRLVYVRAQLRPGQPFLAHMVLAYYPQPTAEPLVLDNLVETVQPASKRVDLVPVFSFNSEGLWQGVGSQTAGDPAVRLSQWGRVMSLAREQGFL